MMFYDLPRVCTTWLLIAASRAQVPQTQVIETLRQVPALEYQEVVKQALLGSFGRRGMDFGRGDKDETCGVLKTLLNHDLNYRKCRTCDDDVCVWAFTTMCKLPRIPPWNRCFSLKMYQEENISRKWCTFSCHSVMSFLGLQVCILPRWILLCAPFTNTKTGAFGMLISS